MAKNQLENACFFGRSKRAFFSHLLRAPLLLSGLAISLAVAVAPATTDAQELTGLTLEQLLDLEVPTVYGASRYDQKMQEAPSSVTVVTGGDIRKFGYRTLADILQSVRGFFVTYDRTYNYLGVRGLNRPGDYNSRILLLVDGHRINDNIYDQAPIGTDFPLSVDLVERVEIIRGPSSSLYGASAFLGVINVITRRGKDLGGAELSLSAGSQRSYTGRGTYGNKYSNGVDLLLSMDGSTSSGARRLYYPELDTPDDNNGVAAGLDGDDATRFFAAAGWRGVFFSAGHVSRDKGTPTGSFLTVLADGRNRVLDERTFLDIHTRQSLNSGGDLAVSLGYNDTAYHGTYIYSANGGGSPVVNRDSAHGKEVMAEIQYSHHVTHNSLLTVGFDCRYNFRQDQNTYNENPAEQLVDIRRRSTISALYLQNELQLLSNLILNAGIRYDHYSSFHGSTNPRLALIYSPLDNSVIKLLYGTAFRAPTVYELYYQDSNKKSNPSLQPEKIRTYEVVYEQQVGEHVGTTLAGFYYEANGLMSQQEITSDTYILSNLDAVVAKGVETEVEAHLVRGLRGRASYTYQEVKDRHTEKTLSNSPRHLAKVNVTVPVAVAGANVLLSPELTYTGPRPTRSGRRTGGFVIANLTLLGKEIAPGLDLSVSAYNLLDKGRADPVSADFRQETIAQDGLSLRVKLVYRF